jgi:hypothetical protein
MNFYSRALSVLALLAMALAGLSQYRPAWAGRMGLDWWSLPDLHDEIRRNEEQDAQINRREQAVIARLVAKSAVIDDLRSGRLTLARAAAEFRRLNALPPACALDPGECCAGEGERLCRQVIFWAMAADRDQAATSRERLEAELTRLLAEHNGIVPLSD